MCNPKKKNEKKKGGIISQLIHVTDHENSIKCNMIKKMSKKKHDL